MDLLCKELTICFDKFDEVVPSVLLGGGEE
jgi:hypothetical protein